MSIKRKLRLLASWEIASMVLAHPTEFPELYQAIYDDVHGLADVRRELARLRLHNRI